MSDRAREAEIGLRTLRLTAEQAFDGSTPRKLLKWVATALEHQRGA